MYIICVLAYSESRVMSHRRKGQKSRPPVFLYGVHTQDSIILAIWTACLLDANTCLTAGIGYKPQKD